MLEIVVVMVAAVVVVTGDDANGPISILKGIESSFSSLYMYNTCLLHSLDTLPLLPLTSLKGYSG